MEFCDKCKALIIINERGTAVCAACGHRTGRKLKIQSSEKTNSQEEIAVVKDGSDETNPIVETTCPKCKNKRCYFWTLQTRASDESETKFYKCVKCKHTWRVYK